MTTNFSPPLPAIVLAPTPTLPLLPSPAKPPPLPLKRLIPEELASRRERDLCFYYDERFTRGHRCASRFFLLVADEEQGNDTPSPNIANLFPNSDDLADLKTQLNPQLTQHPLEPPQAQISLHALAGQTAPETLRMVGQIFHRNVVILVDGSSTHNFVQQRLVKSLGLQAETTPTLCMLVGNGNEVECCFLCRDVNVHVQGHAFTVDLHVLPLCNIDVILGVQWLKALSQVLTDYNDLTIKFVLNYNLIELKGNSDKALLAITPPQLRRLTQTHSASEYFHIRLCSSASPSPTTHPAILTLTHQFSSLFQTPTDLPPSRTTNHSIHLSPYSSLVNVHPYRYPHFQKQEIESQVSCMLQHIIISPSTNPLSSPVLLDKNWDGS